MRVALAFCCFVVACSDQKRSFVPIEGVALGGDAFSSGSSSGKSDADAPIVTLSAPNPRVRGGSDWVAAISITQTKQPLAAAQLQFATDGERIDAFVNLDAGATEVPWTFKLADVSTARFRLVAVDVEGRLAFALTEPFTIDSTPPAVPQFTLDALPVTNQVQIPIRINSCADTEALLVTEGPRSGAEPDYLWQSCSTIPLRAGPPLVTLDDFDGEHTVSVWARDDVGNTSATARTALITLDRAAPSVTLVAPQSGALLNANDAITWTASDQHLLDGATTVEISGDNGVTFNLVATMQPGSGSFVPTNLPQGQYRARVSVADAAGNIGSVTSTGSFDWDPTPALPPAITLLSASPTNAAAVTIAVADCADRPFVLLSESASTPLANDTAFHACASTLPSFTISSVQGTHTIYAWSKDAAGNVSTTASSVSVIFDSEPPSLTLLQPAADQGIQGGTGTQVQWSMSDANQGATPIRLEFSLDGGTTYTNIGAQPIANTGTYAWTPAATPSASARFRITATDQANNTATVEHALIVATQPPVFSILRLNGETTAPAACGPKAAETTNPFALVELQAADPIGAPITHLCFKTKSTTQPARNDPCFQQVSAPPINAAPAASLHLYDIPVRLGFVTGDVTVRVWAKNSAGIVSNNTAGECYERRTIFFNPGDPPEVTNVTGFVVNAPSDPYVESDAKLDALHPNVYVKWNVVLPNGAPTGPTGPIQLEYTTDDFNYQNIPGTFANSAGGGCTIGGSQTGCTVWTPPSALYGSYVKVRVRATDTKDISSVSSSQPPLNAAPLRFLAGNPDPGYGGNAASTLFVSHVTVSEGQNVLGTLAVSSRGVLYFLDRRYGILWVDPATGNTETLVRINGTTADGAVKVATAREVYRITMDHDDNLLFWDYDRIRRLNVNSDRLPVGTANVTTIIGGGSDTDTVGDNQDPLTETRVYAAGSSLWATPNGDIYFNSNFQSAPSTPGSEFAVRHYIKERNPGDMPRVDTIRYSGNGFYSVYFPASRNDIPTNSVANVLFHNAWLAYDLATSSVQRIFSFVYNHPSYGYGIATFDATGRTATPLLVPPNGFLNLNAGFAAFTGMDGNLYLIDQISNLGLYRYNVATNDWTLILGGGPSVQTPCEIDVPAPDANSCRIDVQDVFVDAVGNVYWIAKGKIYTLTEDNKMLKIMGQGYEYGENKPALAARYGNIPSFDYWRDSNNRDRIVTADSLSQRYREAILSNGLSVDLQDNTVQALAGMGRYAYTAQYYSYTWDGMTLTQTDGPDARTLPVSITATTSLNVDRANGFVYPALGYYTSLDYSAGNSYMTRLRRDRATPQWEAFAGGGATPYWSAANGSAGRSLSYAEVYSARSYGVYNGQALYHLMEVHTADGFYGNAMHKLFTINPTGPTPTPPATSPMTHFAGTASPSATPFCAEGAARESCPLGVNYNASYSPASHDTGDGDTPARWLIASDFSNSAIKSFDDAPGGAVRSVTTLPIGTRSWAFRRDLSRGFIYFCDNSNGKLYRQQVEPTVGTAVALAWPVPVRGTQPTLQCRGYALRFDPQRSWDVGKTGTILFSYEQYGLMGVAEYYDELP
jgi:hypothetical protein